MPDSVSQGNIKETFTNSPNVTNDLAATLPTTMAQELKAEFGTPSGTDTKPTEKNIQLATRIQ